MTGPDDRVAISDVKLVEASDAEQQRGLIGAVSFTVERVLRLDGISLRRVSRGGYTLVFPARRDDHGLLRPYMSPMDGNSRRSLEGSIVAALELEEGGAA
ncbi:MAG: hypothetical protein ACI9EF_002664 [Pseudohongiellaceae bacterium]|jgi:hypothetical protein